MLNNFEKEVKEVWECSSLAESKELLISMIRKYKSTTKVEEHVKLVERIEDLERVKLFATDLYMQGFDNTRGLSKKSKKKIE